MSKFTLIFEDQTNRTMSIVSSFNFGACTIFIVTIDLHKWDKPASKRGMAQEITVAKEDLVTNS